jgi:hypothetical protein
MPACRASGIHLALMSFHSLEIGRFPMKMIILWLLGVPFGLLILLKIFGIL